MKFGTAEGTASAVPNLMLICEYLGVSGPKKTLKIEKKSQFLPRRCEPLCPILVKSVGFMRVICLQKLLTFGAIWLVN